MIYIYVKDTVLLQPLPVGSSPTEASYPVRAALGGRACASNP